MNDEKRAGLILLIQNSIAVAVAFGLNLSGEQTAGVLALANSTLTVAMLFWKKGQEHESANPP